MHPDKLMSAVINGKRYSVKSSRLIADDEYWDGQFFERGGRNQFLYRTSKGAFFEVNLTQWEGERDTLLPLTRTEAMDLYEALPEHHVPYEDAFDAVIEEASLGRPTYYGEPMKLTSVWLPGNMIDWLKNQPGGMGGKVRSMIEEAMK